MLHDHSRLGVGSPREAYDMAAAGETPVLDTLADALAALAGHPHR
ncbi:hypothetical protein ACH4XT_16460 [Streptomyces avidinii]